MANSNRLLIGAEMVADKFQDLVYAKPPRRPIRYDGALELYANQEHVTMSYEETALVMYIRPLRRIKAWVYYSMIPRLGYLPWDAVLSRFNIVTHYFAPVDLPPYVLDDMGNEHRFMLDNRMREVATLVFSIDDTPPLYSRSLRGMTALQMLEG